MSRSTPCAKLSTRPARRRAGFSLVECTIASLLVGVSLSAALATVRASLQTQARTTDRMRARLLADEFLNEVLRRGYEDPDQAPVFGRESGESAGSRLLYDDVDDYHNLTSTPPVAEDGAALTGFDDWSVTLTAEYVTAADLNTVSASDTGYKRVRVVVARAGVTLCELSALRTRAWVCPAATGG